MSDPKTLRDVAQMACDRMQVPGGRALGRAAKAIGVTISYTTVDKILAGTYLSRPGSDLLEGLAKLSGLDKAVVYRAANEPMPFSSFAEQLPTDVDLLTPEQRKSVLSIVRSLAAANRAAAEAQIELEKIHEDSGTKTSGETSGGDRGVQQPDGTPPIVRHLQVVTDDNSDTKSDEGGRMSDSDDSIREHDQLQAVAYHGEGATDEDRRIVTELARQAREGSDRKNTDT